VKLTEQGQWELELESFFLKREKEQN
jgi:hypothetical protein